MTEVTVAIVQHPPAILDLAESVRRAVVHIADAAATGAALVVFPETWLASDDRTRWPHRQPAPQTVTDAH